MFKVIVVFGASGAGKTTVGRKLAARLAWEFIEGDAYHPAENVARMKRGEPLDDASRAPWLARLARLIAARAEAGRSAVLACSALKHAYRIALVPSGAGRAVTFVYLADSRALLAERLARRRGHFFPPALLEIQLQDLEPPKEEEPAPVLTVDASLAPEAIVETICASLAERAAVS